MTKVNNWFMTNKITSDVQNPSKMNDNDEDQQQISMSVVKFKGTINVRGKSLMQIDVNCAH